MGLRECPGCGKKVSENAKTCVQCGYNVRNHFLEIEYQAELQKRKEREDKLKAQRMKELEERRAYLETLPPVKKFILTYSKRLGLISLVVIVVAATVILATMLYKNNMRSELEIADGIYLNMPEEKIKKIAYAFSDGDYRDPSFDYYFPPEDDFDYGLKEEKNEYDLDYVLEEEEKEDGSVIFIRSTGAEFFYKNHTLYNGFNHASSITFIFSKYHRLKEMKVCVDASRYKWCDLCPHYEDDFDHFLHDLNLENYEFTQGDGIDRFCDETYYTETDGVDIIITKSNEDIHGYCRYYTVIYKLKE